MPPAALPGQTFVVASELEGCLGQDPQGKLARANARLASSATACAAAGVSFNVFAGSCGAETTASTFSACIDNAVEQRTASAIRAAHSL